MQNKNILSKAWKIKSRYIIGTLLCGMVGLAGCGQSDKVGDADLWKRTGRTGLFL